MSDSTYLKGNCLEIFDSCFFHPSVTLGFANPDWGSSPIPYILYKVNTVSMVSKKQFIVQRKCNVCVFM
jgi:hypothetical protein